MQMKIEILDGSAKMAPVGSAVLKSLQNQSTPILDLMVRESIQNSLDAKDRRHKCVTVDYQLGKFLSKDLNKHFEVISKKLDEKYKKGYYDYLSIKDKGTNGLTGYVNKSDVPENEDLGNLIKLVYDLNKPQDLTFSGGSWGVGKTIYYRLGIGLVIYYSHIYNVATNAYESRLVACMVEDEKSQSAILPCHRNCSKKSGIAWWGEMLKSKGYTVPITDEGFIEEFLKIFDIEPYGEKETGTTIIIPYLKNNLLSSNIKQNEDGTPRKQHWHTSLDDYIRIAVQRWYCPRLENKYYPYKGYLKASVNGEFINRKEFEPVFLLIQDLYNRAALGNLPDKYKDSFTSDSIMGVEEIRLNKTFSDSPLAGRVAWCKVSKSFLKICPPDNKYVPYLYFDLDIKDTEKNKPVLTFCRMPGMLVSYVQDGDWLYSVPSCGIDEYIFAVFVLNSENRLSINDYPLDFYMKEGERSDHANWEDHPVNDQNPKLVQKILNQTARKLSKCFVEKSDDTETRRIIGLSQQLGNMILPPEDFGKESTGTDEAGDGGGTTGSFSEEKKGKKKGGGGGGGGGTPPTKKPLTVRFIPSKTIYSEKQVSYFYYIIATAKCSNFNIDIKISKEGGNMIYREWVEDYGLNPPFELSSIFLTTLKVDNEDINRTYHVRKIVGFNKSSFANDDINISVKSTANKLNYGAEVLFASKKLYELELKVTLDIRTRDIKPHIDIS